MPHSTNRKSNNSQSANQHHATPIMDQIPDLPEIIQGYIDQNALQREIPELIRNDYDLAVSLRTVQRIMTKHNTKTSRRNKVPDDDQGVAILAILEDDPLKRWGVRTIKEKLSAHGIHIPRDFITKFIKNYDPEAAASRHPQTRKIHSHGLYSAGPNEEWCVDGHEKILRSMGIAIWGVNDKYARVELSLDAVPSARKSTVPPVLYLCLIKKIGGIPVTTASDMGSELGKLIGLITSLRDMHQPFLPADTLPAHRAVKSVFNITRERGWRPLWNKELGNIESFYKAQEKSIGLKINDPIHQGIRLWLWAKVVQLCLYKAIIASENHRVRFQADRMLPSGGRRIDFYRNPGRWGGTDLLIKVNTEIIDALLARYDRPKYTQFGTGAMVKLCECLYDAVGSPLPVAKNGWVIWKQMTDILPLLVAQSPSWRDLETKAGDLQAEEDDDGSDWDSDELPSEVQSMVHTEMDLLSYTGNNN